MPAPAQPSTHAPPPAPPTPTPTPALALAAHAAAAAAAHAAPTASSTAPAASSRPPTPPPPPPPPDCDKHPNNNNNNNNNYDNNSAADNDTCDNSACSNSDYNTRCSPCRTSSNSIPVMPNTRSSHPHTSPSDKQTAPGPRLDDDDRLLPHRQSSSALASAAPVAVPAAPQSSPLGHSSNLPKSASPTQPAMPSDSNPNMNPISISAATSPDPTDAPAVPILPSRRNDRRHPPPAYINNYTSNPVAAIPPASASFVQIPAGFSAGLRRAASVDQLGIGMYHLVPYSFNSPAVHPAPAYYYLQTPQTHPPPPQPLHPAFNHTTMWNVYQHPEQIPTLSNYQPVAQYSSNHYQHPQLHAVYKQSTSGNSNILGNSTNGSGGSSARRGPGRGAATSTSNSAKMSSVVSPDLSGSGNGSASTSIGVIGLDGDDSIGCASGGDNTLIADDDCAALSPTTIGDIHSAPDGASDLASTIRLQAQQSDKTNQSEIESGSHTLTNGLGLSGGESEQTANVSSSDGPTLSATSPSNNVSRYLSSRKSTPSLHPSQSSIHQQQLMQQQQQQRMQNQLASFPQASTQHYHAYDSQNMVLQQTHLATQTQYPPQAFRSQQQSFLPTGIAHPAYASQPPYLNTPFIQYPNPTPFAYGQVQAPLSQTSHIGGPNNQIPFIPQHHPQQLPKPQTHIQSQQPPQQAWFFGGMLPAAKKKPSRRGKKKAKSGLRSDSANTALTNGTTATNSSAGSVIEGSSVEGAHPGDKLGSFAESGQGEEVSTEKEDIQLDRSDASLPQSIALATPAADVVKAPASVDNHNHHHHAENAANADFRQLVSPSSSSSFQDHRRLNSDSPSPLPKSQLQAQLQLQQPRHALPPKPFSPSAGRLSSTSETIRVTPGLDLQRQDSTPSLELQTHPRGMTIVNAAAGAAGNTNISTPVTAGVTATKKVVKAVSVTRSKIAAPAGPYFRLGDLYTWAKNRIVESGELEDDTSVEDVMDALAEAVGFSKISSEGPWSLLRCLGSELFAIGTSDSDNRRHLLIPEPLALRASQVIADFIYERTQIQMTMLRTPAKPVSRPKISAITSRSYAHAAATTVNSNGVAAAAAVAPANETDLFGSAQLPSFADVIGVRVTSFDDYAAIAKALEKHRKETARIERDARESLLLKTKLAEAARVVANAPDDGTVFVSLDIEAYERDQAKILEIGWTMYNPRSTGSALIAKHFVCEENAGLANGKFVPNNRHQFRFGETEVESLDYIIDLLKVDMNIDPSADGDAYAQPAVLVGHSVSADIGWLRTCGVFIDSTAYDCFDEEVEDGRDDEVGHGPQQHQQHSPPKSPVIGPTSENIALPNQHHNIKFIFDTADLDCGLHGRLRAQKFSVKKMCSGLGIIDDESDIPFHNAGNDAYLTMQAFLKMATLSHDFNTLAK